MMQSATSSSCASNQKQGGVVSRSHSELSRSDTPYDVLQSAAAAAVPAIKKTAASAAKAALPAAKNGATTAAKTAKKATQVAVTSASKVAEQAQATLAQAAQVRHTGGQAGTRSTFK